MITSGSADCRRVSPSWPFCPPGFLPEDSRRLDTRAGFFNPSLDGGLPLLELFRPSRRSSSATRATSVAICDACACISAISASRDEASTGSADDATYTCAGAGNFIQAPAVTRLPITPQFKINDTARYEAQVGGDAKGHVQAVAVHQSSAASDIRTFSFAPGTGNSYNPAASLGRLAAYTTADFAVGVTWPFLSAEIVVENAFDKRAQFSRYAECGSCTIRPYIVANTPRTIGVRLGHNF
jgi:hypothetical protein